MTLLPFELDWVRTIGRALLPPGALDGTLDGADMGERFYREVARSPWHVALAMRASLWLTWLSPLWMLGLPHAFGGVGDETRVELLERLLKHKRYAVRMAATFLKLTLCTLALGDERVLRALDAYDLRPPAARSAS